MSNPLRLIDIILDDTACYEVMVTTVGDCLKLEYDSLSFFVECSGLEDGKYPCGYETIIDCGKIYEHNFMPSGWGCNWKVTEITSEEFQSEFNKHGYEYDFDTHTAKKIWWNPEAGDTIWSINTKGFINEWTFSGRGLFVPDSMDFRTRELAEAALEQLKKAKHF